MSGLGLNLAGAQEASFDAIPSGTYKCKVVKLEMKETKGSDGAVLPKGTPMINCQFKVTEGDYTNRVVFRQLIIAPAKIGNKPYEHKGMMDGILLNFFKCVGYSEEEVKSEKGFDPDFADIQDKELLVVVGQKQKYNAPDGVMDNVVKGFKPTDSAVAGNLL